MPAAHTRVAIAFPLVLMLGALAGCQSDHAQHADQGGAQQVSHAGARSDLIFDGPEAAYMLEAIGGEQVLPEYARRDADLGVRSDEPVLASQQWAIDEAPELDDTRYVYYPVHTSSSVLLVPYQSRYRRADRSWRYDGPSYHGGHGYHGHGGWGHHHVP